MSTTNQLPEPDLGYIKTDKSNQPAFSARQMREIMKHALQARTQLQGAPIGEVGTMPGTSGFTMACFRADEIPVGTKLYTTPQPAQATQVDVTDEREAFESSALMVGSLFKRRADDPDKYWDGNVQDDWELWQARAIFALPPERVQMTEDQVWNNDALMSANGIAGFKMDALMRIVRAVESHHSITTKAKGEQ